MLVICGILPRRSKCNTTYVRLRNAVKKIARVRLFLRSQERLSELDLLVFLS